MKKEIDPDIIEETKRCCFSFQCLKENGKPHCEIEGYAMIKVFYVKCQSCIHCDYQTKYGFRNLCLCPTRKELCKKYDIWKL